MISQQASTKNSSRFKNPLSAFKSPQTDLLHTAKKEDKKTGYDFQYIDIEGIKLRYAKNGEGPPILLLHTIRTQLEYWKFIVPELSKSNTVYLVDLPGHGLSDLPEVDYQHSFFHQTIKKFIQSLSLENATIVGESIGAVLALTLAADKDSNIKEVFALNPYDYAENNGNGIKRGNLLARFVFRLSELPVIGWTTTRLEFKFMLKGILKGGFYHKSKLPNDLLNMFHQTGNRKGYRKAETRYFKAWRSWVAAKKEYPKIEVPVTLVYGEADWSNETERVRNAEFIPHAKMIIVEKTGHFSAVESPKAILEILLK